MISNQDKEFILQWNNSTEGKISYIPFVDWIDEKTHVYVIENKAWILWSKWKDGLRIDIYVLPKFRKQGIAKNQLKPIILQSLKNSKLYFNIGTPERKKFYYNLFKNHKIQQISETIALVTHE